MKFAVIFGCLSSLIATQAVADITAKVTEYGYYKALGEIERKRNASTPSGYIRSGTNVELVKQTNDIPIVINQLFGFKFLIEGFEPDVRSASLVLNVIHPEITRPNGSKTKGYSAPVNIDVWQGVSENRSGYKFDKEFEMVEGEWVFQYKYNNNMIIEKKFNLYKPGADAASQLPTTKTEATSSEVPKP